MGMKMDGNGRRTDDTIGDAFVHGWDGYLEGREQWVAANGPAHGVLNSDT